ncbi:hypothetical protein HLH44_03790 [Gluconacetobacter sp. 1c LMG 22058]|uniref:ANTAR domain-containing protein n=1 Tax=Gluconacetobacter dulcium TaxID=2729096 RepID=A0A7W4JXM5_9PROT|nr:hypothetical protein [Gluconacetobacter dulcium]MBB2196594.1 hypothetical protein [Gluconacetobacter dulcium]
MNDVTNAASQLVDLMLSDPPTDNADLLDVATKLERDARGLSVIALGLVREAQRLRDFAAARQARMDGTPDPLLH